MVTVSRTARDAINTPIPSLDDQKPGEILMRNQFLHTPTATATTFSAKAGLHHRLQPYAATFRDSEGAEAGAQQDPRRRLLFTSPAPAHPLRLSNRILF